MAYVFGIIIGWWYGKKIIVKKFQASEEKSLSSKFYISNNIYRREALKFTKSIVAMREIHFEEHLQLEVTGYGTLYHLHL